MNIPKRNQVALILLLTASGCIEPGTPIAAAKADSPTGAEGAEVVAGPPQVIEPVFVLGESDSPANDTPVLYRPSSIGIDSDNFVYVLDGGNHRVVKLNSTGHQIAAFGRKGKGPGELSSASRSNHLVVGNDRVVVLDRASTTFSVFSTDGDYVERFRVRRGVSDLAIEGITMVVSHSSTSPAENSVSIVSLDGEVLNSFGDPLLEQTPGRGPLAVLNRFSVAVGDGRIAQVFRQWPLIRLHFGPDGAHTDTWLDFEWWDRPKQAEWLARPQELLDEPGDISSHDEVRPVVFWDIAYGQKSSHWYGLLAVGIVQVFDHDGTPLNSYWVRDPEGPARLITSLAVSPDESLMCTVDVLQEFVSCFSLVAEDDLSGQRQVVASAGGD